MNAHTFAQKAKTALGYPKIIDHWKLEFIAPRHETLNWLNAAPFVSQDTFQQELQQLGQTLSFADSVFGQFYFGCSEDGELIHCGRPPEKYTAVEINIFDGANLSSLRALAALRSQANAGLVNHELTRTFDLCGSVKGASLIIHCFGYDPKGHIYLHDRRRSWEAAAHVKKHSLP